jgi:hypothetical protein
VENWSEVIAGTADIEMMLSTKLMSSIYFNWHYFFGIEVVVHPGQIIESHKTIYHENSCCTGWGLGGNLNRGIHT